MGVLLLLLLLLLQVVVRSSWIHGSSRGGTATGAEDMGQGWEEGEVKERMGLALSLRPLQKVKTGGSVWRAGGEGRRWSDGWMDGE
ncbi:hypothetical protein EDD21DRAFT_370450 [Dissophora ornata]|nr:hypothetical protein EDD21DRAFT_370450 [Dissophora ornata]